MKRNTDIRIYNMLFPMYLLWLVPTIWIVVIPANFFIDSMVALLTLSALKLSRITIYKKTILKIWRYGFLADIIGSLFLLIISQVSCAIYDSGFLFTETIRKEFNNFRLALEYDPYSNALAFIVTVLLLRFLDFVFTGLI